LPRRARPVLGRRRPPGPRGLDQRDLERAQVVAPAEALLLLVEGVEERDEARLVGGAARERPHEAVAERAGELLGDGAGREAGAVEVAGLRQQAREVAGDEGVG